MKRKTLKITESTLFIYKQGSQIPNNTTESTTDTTSIMTTTTHTTGVNSEKNRR